MFLDLIFCLNYALFGYFKYNSNPDFLTNRKSVNEKKYPINTSFATYYIQKKIIKHSIE